MMDDVLIEIKLAEHKIDQYLQGQGPGTVRLGVALQACRRAILLLEKSSVPKGEV